MPRRTAHVSLALLLAASISTTAMAESPDKQPGPADATITFGDKYDWIELTSGEWLKGEIKGMVDGELVFDSDNLDDLTISWDDIEQIRSPRKMRLLLNDETTVLGHITLKDGDIIIEDHAPIAHKDVVVMVPRRMSEIQYWSINATIGATFQAGNTTETSYNATANLTRQSVETRFNLAYIGNYSKNLGKVTTDNQRVNTFFDYFINSLLFIRFVQAEYYLNSFQNIATQVTAGPGLGFQFYRRPKIKWSLVVGPFYEYTRFDSVEAGQSSSDSTAAGWLTTNIATKPFKNFKLGANGQMTFTNKRSGLLTTHLITTASYKLANSIFQISATGTWDRIQEPLPTSSGVRPEQNDFQLLLGFGIDY